MPEMGPILTNAINGLVLLILAIGSGWATGRWQERKKALAAALKLETDRAAKADKVPILETQFSVMNAQLTAAVATLERILQTQTEAVKTAEQQQVLLGQAAQALKDIRGVLRKHADRLERLESKL